MMRSLLGAFVGLAIAIPPPARGAVWELTLGDAVRLARRQSPDARQLALEERRESLAFRGARGALWPDLALDVVAPQWSQEFSVGLLPSAPGDSTGSRTVYDKITTTSRNASGDLRLRQLLPWKGALTAQGSVFYRDEETTPENIRAPRRDYQVAASLGLEVPLLGDDAARRTLRHADLEWARARSRARSARAQLEFETVSNYLDLLRARLSLEIVRSAASHAASAEEVARRKVAAGLLAEAEALRAEVVHAEREARLAEVESEVQRAADAFKLFLGVDSADSIALVEPLAAFQPTETPEACLARALQQRSDLGLLQREIELLDRDRRARRSHVPDVSLSLRYGGAASETALDRAVEKIVPNDLSALVTLHVPLWDAGRGAAEEEQERAAVELRQLELETTRGRIGLEVRDAVRQLRDAARRTRIYDASQRVADEMLRINAERFERGLIDTQAYLSAQADAATARLEGTAALLDLYRARARLRLVTLGDGEE